MGSPSLDENTSKEVLRQVEFYFSDSNIPRDKFLKNAIESSPDGLVGLNLICSFKKMRGYLKLGEISPEEVSEDTLKAVADTLRKSNTLKLSEDGMKVGRLTALLSPDEVIEQLDARTIAASPLKYDVKREDVESYFGKYAKVSSVRLPRHTSDKKVFCGTALIEFSSEKDAENSLQHNFVFDGVQLDICLKKDFDADREKQIKENMKTFKNGEKFPSEDSSYPKGLIVAFKLKKRTATDNEQEIIEKDANEELKEPEKNIVPDNPNAESSTPEEKTSEGNALDSEGKNEKTNLDDCKKNLNVVLREDLKEALEKFGRIKFIDFKIGEQSGYIRFEQPEAAQKVRAAAVLAEDGGLTVKNFIATFEPVAGDAEKEYWKLLRENQSSYRETRGGRGRGGKNQGGWNKQARFKDRESNNRPHKSQKVEA